MDLVLVQQENIVGAPVGVGVEARLVFGGSHPLFRPPQGAPELGGEWVFH